jgi:2-polyprenyl-3-methyl-5-hydroxy-6-metoxy-1,4-benzoquinol methylase
MDKYQKTFITWNKIAELYEEKFMDVDLYQDTFDSFVDALPNRNSSILDLGCGPGNITSYLLNKNSELQIKGIDVSKNMVDLAKKNNPSAEFEQMDIRNIDQINDRFNGIICGFCIPYLSESDCSKLIAACNDLLHDDGILYLSFVEGNYIDSNFTSNSSGDRAYFYYHTLERLKKELKINYFKIKEHYLKPYKKADGTQEHHTILILEKTLQNKA